MYYGEVPNNNLYLRDNNFDNPNYFKNIPIEQTNVSNILKLNKGKKLTINMLYPDNDKIQNYPGILETSGQDYIIISNPQNGSWYLLPLLYLHSIKFEEKINI